MTKIGDGCFQYIGIEILTIPANVISIGYYCFNNSNLKKLRMMPTTPPKYYSGLGLPSGATIYVDELYIDAYKETEPWKNFKIMNSDGFPIGEVVVEGLKYWIYSKYKAELLANDYNRDGEFTIPGTFTYDSNEYTVTAIGEKCFYNYDKITNIVIPKTITKIGEYAFYGCRGLSSIDIPEGVTIIPNNCFSECGKLTNISLPSDIIELGDCVFYWCHNLKSLSIPESVTKIGHECFYNTGIDILTIPANVISIGYYCFNDNLKKLRMKPITPPICDEDLGLSSDAKIYVDETYINAYKETEPWKNYNIENPEGFPIGEVVVDGLKYRICPNKEAELIANDYNREGEFTIPGTFTYDGNEYTVTAIGENCFYNCNSITNIIIPNTITELYGNAFAYCNNLMKFRMFPTIPPTCNGDLGLSSDATIYVDETAIDAYKETEPWKNYNIENPDGFPLGKVVVEGLKYWIYPKYNAELLANDYNREGEITIPSTFTYDENEYTVTAIGTRCFTNCDSITNIVIPETIKEIGTDAFCGCSRLFSINIPDGVTNIPGYCFFGCSNLTSVILPETITELGESVFVLCNNLNSLSIPESVTKIGYGCFQNTLFETITIPANVKIIGNSCFFQSQLKKLRMLPTTPPECGDLGLSSDATIYVDDTAIDAYKETEPWKNYNIENPDGFPIYIDVDKFRYLYYRNNKEAELVEYNDDSAENLIIPETFDYNGSTYTVATLKSNCFDNCKGLKKISIPNSVKNLEVGCFNGITPSILLTSPTPPQYQYTSYISVFIPKELHDIYKSDSNWAKCIIYDANNFKFINIDIDGYTFDIYPYKETAIITNNSLKEDNNISIPSSIVHNSKVCSITSLADNCFKNNTQLLTLSIPQSIENIGNNCFVGCEKLKIIKSFPITPPVCNGNLSLPSKVEIYVPDEAVETYKNDEKWGQYNIIGIESYSIKTSATTGNLRYKIFPFANTASLINNNYRFETIEVPSSMDYEDETYTVTAIDDNCFYTCSSLKEVILPNTITHLGKQAFFGCSGITSFTISESVTTIGENCFRSCENLDAVKCLAVVPPVIINKFGVKNTATIYVPTESVDRYKAADIWKDYLIKSVDEFVDGIYAPIMDADSDMKVYDINGLRLEAKGKGLRILRSKGKTKKVVTK